MQGSDDDVISVNDGDCDDVAFWYLGYEQHGQEDLPLRLHCLLYIPGRSDG